MLKAGGLFVSTGSLLLSLLFGAQRAGITALALALGEVKSQIRKELFGAEGLDPLALGGGTHVVRGDDRAKYAPAVPMALQAGDAAGTEAPSALAGRIVPAGWWAAPHRQERTVGIGGGDGCLVAHHGVLRERRSHPWTGRWKA